VIRILELCLTNLQLEYNGEINRKMRGDMSEYSKDWTHQDMSIYMDSVGYAFGAEVLEDLTALREFFAAHNTNVLPLAVLQSDFASAQGLTVRELATTLDVGVDRGLLRRFGLTPAVEMYPDTAA
jgi:hypothetical protein